MAKEHPHRPHHRACRFAALFLTAAGLSTAVATPAFAAGTPAHLASTRDNGNGHFGGEKPEAFVLSDGKGVTGEVGVTFSLDSNPKTSRPRIVLKYIDDGNWAYIGADQGNHWFLEYKQGSKSDYPDIKGLPALEDGKDYDVSAQVKNGRIEVEVNGQSSTVDCDPVEAMMGDAGRVGMGAATSQDEKAETTDLHFTDFTMGSATTDDFTAWSLYEKSAPSSIWDPGAPAADSRTWIKVTAGPNNTANGSHDYSKPEVKAPVLVTDNTAASAVHAGDKLKLTLVPDDSRNFGVFYSYMDDDHFLYLGWDGKWYVQYENGTKTDWPELSKTLPTPKRGEPLAIQMSVDGDTVNVAVNGRKASVKDKAFADAMTAMNGKGKVGVKTVGNGSMVKFCDATRNGKDLMADTWEFAAQRDGQGLDKQTINFLTVSGTVKNADGQPVEGAEVLIGSDRVTTGKDGAWSIKHVEPQNGKVSIRVKAAGYQTVTKDVPVTGSTVDPVQIVLAPKGQLDLGQFAQISSDSMTAYVSKTFPQVARYVMKGDDPQVTFMRGQEEPVTTFKVNGRSVTPQVATPTISGNAATYVMTVNDGDLNFAVTVSLKVEGTNLTWAVTNIKKAQGCAPIKSLDFTSNNLLTVTDGLDKGANFAGAIMAFEAGKPSGDRFISFDNGFKPNSTNSFMYGILGTNAFSAGILSNSEAEHDQRITLNNGEDTMGLASSVWYYEQGDTNAQGYAAAHPGTTYPVSDLPWVKVAVSKGDVNGDKAVDWNDGAIATRSILNKPYGSDAVKDLVSYRVVMNFGSEVTNPYSRTADNLKKVSLITDGMPQAIILKGYGNEGHDSANSEYADIAVKEGGAEGLRDLIKIAHQYNTEVGLHINAEEIYPEARSMNERMVQGSINGWGWMDQSVKIDKLWDLSSQARWNRLVQLYDRVNGTKFANKDFEAGQYVGDPAVTGAQAADMATLAQDAKKRPNNLDFIYLDVWMQDTWESRRVADEINSLGWRLTTEYSSAHEWDSTGSHLSMDPKAGGKNKGINSEIVRFLRNEQRDTSVMNDPSKKGSLDNPLLGGAHIDDFEGWQGRQDFNEFVKTMYVENLPTRFLQHYQVWDWDDYAAGEKPAGTATNREKKIVLKSEDGKNTVEVERKTNVRREDNVIERTIKLNGTKVLDEGAYLLPWDQDGEQKLFHYNVDGGSTTWDLLDGWANTNVTIYKLTDQGREKVKDVHAGARLTLDAEPCMPYVVVRASGSKAMPTADNVQFGEGTGVVDPGFNSYKNGDKLDAAVWKGSVKDPSVAIETLPTGDQVLKVASPAKDVELSCDLTGLTADKTYVLEMYVGNESDANTTVAVDAGDRVYDRSFGRSTIKNYTASDPKHTGGPQSDLMTSYMTRVYVKFTAESPTAKLVLGRAAGEGATRFDSVRLVENEAFPVQDAQGNFAQDFEHAVSGLYPFVIGPTGNGSDGVTHLSQANAPFTSAGWHGKQVDDTINGSWSIKHHDNINFGHRTGLIYRTMPQTLAFEAGGHYKVEFDYQAGTGSHYAMVVGSGEDKFDVPTAFLKPTAKDGKGNTQHVSMDVTGADDGTTWIGLYSGRNSGGQEVGAMDFVLDNLKVTRLDPKPEPPVKPEPPKPNPEPNPEPQPEPQPQPQPEPGPDGSTPLIPLEPAKPVDPNQGDSIPMTPLEPAKPATRPQGEEHGGEDQLVQTGDPSLIAGIFGASGALMAGLAAFKTRRRKK